MSSSFTCDLFSLKGSVTLQKWQFCHHLLTLMSFQTLSFSCATQVWHFFKNVLDALVLAIKINVDRSFKKQKTKKHLKSAIKVDIELRYILYQPEVWNNSDFLMFSNKVSYAHQVCIYLIKYAVKNCEILLQLQTVFYLLQLQFLLAIIGAFLCDQRTRKVKYVKKKHVKYVTLDHKTSLK